MPDTRLTIRLTSRQLDEILEILYDLEAEYMNLLGDNDFEAQCVRRLANALQNNVVKNQTPKSP